MDYVSTDSSNKDDDQLTADDEVEKYDDDGHRHIMMWDRGGVSINRKTLTVRTLSMVFIMLMLHLWMDW
jgi:hypothetical protein